MNTRSSQKQQNSFQAQEKDFFSRNRKVRESNPLHHLNLVHDTKKNIFSTLNFTRRRFSIAPWRIKQSKQKGRPNLWLFIHFCSFLIPSLIWCSTKTESPEAVYFFHVVLSLCSHFSMKFNRGYVNLLNYTLFLVRVHQKPGYIVEFMVSLWELRSFFPFLHNWSWFHLLICIKLKIIEWEDWKRSKVFHIKYSCLIHAASSESSMTVKPSRGMQIRLLVIYFRSSKYVLLWYSSWIQNILLNRLQQ